jgi:hypothetical protein
MDEDIYDGWYDCKGRRGAIWISEKVVASKNWSRVSGVILHELTHAVCHRAGTGARRVDHNLQFAAMAAQAAAELGWIDGPPPPRDCERWPTSAPQSWPSDVRAVWPGAAKTTRSH